MDARPDPFESALRAVLQDRARRAPAALELSTMLDGVMAGERSRGESRGARWVGAVAAMAASVVLVVVAGLLLARWGGSSWSVAGDGDAGPAIAWDSGAVRLEADSIRIVGLGTFTGTPDVVNGAPAISIHSDPGSSTYRTLEVRWQEHGVPMRLSLYLAANDVDWWVTEMRTYDGSSGGAWIEYPGERFRTPLGGTFSGSFAGPGTGERVDGTLRLDGLRLTAFAPGTGPAVHTGCGPWRIVAGGDAGTPEDLVGMPPAQAATRLRARGVCFEFRWSYPTGPGTGYSERWCVPPPTGRVSSVDALDDGVVLLMVSDDSGIVREVREQPLAGWGCPTDQRGVASPVPDGSPAPGGAPPTSEAGDTDGAPRSVSVVAEPLGSPTP